MELGPPVCPKCMIIARLTDRWFCPKCHTVALPNCLWEYTEEYQQRFEDNTKIFKDNEKLLEFMKGESNGNS